MKPFLLFLSAMCVVATTVAAQVESLDDAATRIAAERVSLADLGRKTAAERADPTRVPRRLYTNADLVAVPPPNASLTPFVVTGLTAPPVVTSLPTAAAGEPSEYDRQAQYRTIATKDEEYWKQRMSDLQLALDRDRTLLAAASQVDVERQVGTSEYTLRLTALVVSDQLAISTLEEQARRANVPPGWLRP